MSSVVHEDAEYQRRLLTRFEWADAALRKAGFGECGFSATNGRSVYYSRSAPKCKCADGCQCPCPRVEGGICDAHDDDLGDDVVGMCSCNCEGHCCCGQESRVRVSDHYAHALRSDESGRTSFIHTIRVDGPSSTARITQQEVEAAVQEAIRLIAE